MSLHRFRPSVLGASVSLLALTSLFPATASANFLTGKITDSSGQAGFEGAIVYIDEIGRSVTTDRFGQYRFNNLTPGTYDIRVSYIGTPGTSSSVTIPETGATVDFKIGADVEYEDNIIVVGQKAAQASALNQQRASGSIVTVIDSDGLGNFPDTTVADSLQRAVGISVETDQGEGRYVSIRGINTDLISSSINGVRTPSPEDRRGVLLDGVPSDLLDGIEVQKSLTPDVDADSLGGVINLKTTSAFDRKDNFLRLKVEGTYNEITEEISPKATATYSNTWNDTFGAALSLSYQDLAIEAHNNEVGEWNFEDGEFIANDDYEQRWYDLTRERVGIVANFDWRVNDSTDLYLRTLFNRYEDDEIRNKFEFRELDSFIRADGDISFYEVGEIDAEVRQRKEIREIQTYSIGGETVTGSWSFDYQGSYAFATEDDSDNHDVNFRSNDEQEDENGAVIFDFSNPEEPVFSGSAIPYLLDPSNYSLDTFEVEDTVNEDTEYAVQFNAAYDTSYGDTQIEWKAGVKYRDRNKFRDQNLEFFERDDVNLANFIRDDAEITDWRLANRMFEWPDANLTRALRGGFSVDERDDDDTLLESTVGDFDIDEKIFAAYGMGTFEFGNTSIIAGVRVEDTQTDLQGFFFEEPSEQEIDGMEVEVPANITERNVSRSYTDVLPSVNIRHNFSEQLIGRAAYYKAVVRPSFGEMAPIAFLNDDRDELELGNPNLDPYDANNFDLSLEYYPTNLSVISVGLFYKEIEDGIFPDDFDIDEVPDSIDLSFLPPAIFDGLEEVNTFINVEDSRIFGAEFNLVQNLGDLSDALDGFLFSANLTLSDSESTLPDGRKVPFLKQADTVGNAQIGYDKGKWDLRVSVNYRGSNLDELVDEDLDRFIDDRWLLSATAKYKATDQLQLYVEGKNLLDAPEYYYFGDESRLSQYDEFGSSFVFGARFTY